MDSAEPSRQDHSQDDVWTSTADLQSPARQSVGRDGRHMQQKEGACPTEMPTPRISGAGTRRALMRLLMLCAISEADAVKCDSVMLRLMLSQGPCPRNL